MDFENDFNHGFAIGIICGINLATIIAGLILLFK